MKLYHYGKSGYEYIKSPVMLYPEHIVDEKYKKKYGEIFGMFYSNSVSLTIPKLDTEDIDRLVRNGFKLWNNVESMYVIDTDTNKDNISLISIESVPEINNVLNKVWEKWNKDINADIMTDEEYVFHWSALWMNLISAKLINIPKLVYLDDFESIVNEHEHWLDTEKWIKENIKRGSRNQYASYIPHVQILIKEPLIIEEEVKLR